MAITSSSVVNRYSKSYRDNANKNKRKSTSFVPRNNGVRRVVTKTVHNRKSTSAPPPSLYDDDDDDDDDSDDDAETNRRNSTSGSKSKQQQHLHQQLDKSALHNNVAAQYANVDVMAKTAEGGEDDPTAIKKKRINRYTLTAERLKSNTDGFLNVVTEFPRMLAPHHQPPPQSKNANTKSSHNWTLNQSASYVSALMNDCYNESFCSVVWPHTNMYDVFDKVEKLTSKVDKYVESDLRNGIVRNAYISKTLHQNDAEQTDVFLRNYDEYYNSNENDDPPQQQQEDIAATQSSAIPNDGNAVSANNELENSSSRNVSVNTNETKDGDDNDDEEELEFDDCNANASGAVVPAASNTTIYETNGDSSANNKINHTMNSSQRTKSTPAEQQERINDDITNTSSSASKSTSSENDPFHRKSIDDIDNCEEHSHNKKEQQRHILEDSDSETE